MSATLRLAQTSDLPSLGRLGARLMRTHYEFDRLRFLSPGEGSAEGYASFLGSVLGESGNVVFVAEVDGAIAGYVYAALEPLSWKELRGPAGFIHDLVVDGSAQRGGIATQLMDKATAWLREQGAPRVMLWTASPNAAAQTLFKRLGFRDTMVEMTLEL